MTLRVTILLSVLFLAGCADQSPTVPRTSYERGEAAYKAGIPVTENPYTGEKWQSNKADWQSGWAAAKQSREEQKGGPAGPPQEDPVVHQQYTLGANSPGPTDPPVRPQSCICIPRERTSLMPAMGPRFNSERARKAFDEVLELLVTKYGCLDTPLDIYPFGKLFTASREAAILTLRDAVNGSFNRMRMNHSDVASPRRGGSG